MKGGGGALREACSSNLEYGEPSQHLLNNTGKPSESCAEMAGVRTCRMRWKQVRFGEKKFQKKKLLLLYV